MDVANPQHQDAALKIQTEYRRHAAVKEVETIREDQAVATIQAGFRGLHDRKHVAEMKEVPLASASSR